MPTPSIQTLRNDAQQVLNLDSISAVRSVVAATLANANAGTPLNPNLTTQQLWNEFYQIVTQPKSDIESIIANQLMKFMYAPPAPGGVGGNQQVIYNDNGVLAGDTKFLWDDALNKLDIDGSATITGDLTVATNRLVVNASGVCIGTTTATPFAGNTKAVVGGGSGAIGLTLYGGVANTAGLYFADGIVGNETYRGYLEYSHATDSFAFGTAGANRYTIDSTGISTWSVGGSTAMTLNATGLAVGTASPTYKLDVNGVARVNSGGDGLFLSSAAGPDLYIVGTNYYNNNGTEGVQTVARPSWKIEHKNSSDALAYLDIGFRAASAAASAFTSRFKIDGSGNVGVGVTPSAWGASFKPVQIGSGTVSSAFVGQTNSPVARIMTNSYFDGTNFVKVQNNTAGMYAISNNVHEWYNATTGTGTFSFTQAMTLTAAGELLIGATTGAGGRLWIQSSGSTAGVEIARLTSSAINNSFIVYVTDAEGFNGGATALKVGRNATTSRSINAGGTINASGADYAEYMVKCSDFLLSKGDVAGIDANGKLTNVFADAVSFVVKSTDPSYVGNDKWGVGLEGADLEAARQLVDRIAFAGQVPVNVTGAKAGDYIVPVVNGTGIKGQAVSNPTFEQYQLAVGKVISIDADGRARIIVKVA